MHKYAWEIHMWKYLKVDKWEQKGQVRRKKSWEEPRTELCNQDISRAQPGEKNPIAHDTVFNQEEKNESVSIPEGVCSLSWSWAQRPRKGAIMFVRRLAFQAESQSKEVLLLCSLQELASLCLWCSVPEDIICNPKTSSSESLFP